MNRSTSALKSVLWWPAALPLHSGSETIASGPFCICPLAILYPITQAQTQISLSEANLLGTAPPCPYSCHNLFQHVTLPITKRKKKNVCFHHVQLSRTPAPASGTSLLLTACPNTGQRPARSDGISCASFQVTSKTLPASRPRSDFCGEPTRSIPTSADLRQVILLACI